MLVASFARHLFLSFARHLFLSFARHLFLSFARRLFRSSLIAAEKVARYCRGVVGKAAVKAFDDIVGGEAKRLHDVYFCRREGYETIWEKLKGPKGLGAGRLKEVLGAEVEVEEVSLRCAVSLCLSDSVVTNPYTLSLRHSQLSKEDKARGLAYKISSFVSRLR